jgi:hypothetical protein
MRKLRFTLLAGCLLLSSAAARADTLYDESVSGDLSNDGLAPTSLSFSLGSNQVLGTTGRATATDRDYFTFTIPAGEVLSMLVELPGTTSGGVSFIGLEAGPQLTLPTNPPDATGLLGWMHYGPPLIGLDILPLMGTAGQGSTGFVPPLPAGTYSIWIQDFNSGSFTYGFNFVVSAPEPALGGLLLGALSLALVSRSALSRRRVPR